MNFSTQSAIYMKPFLDAFGACVNIDQDKPQQKIFNDTIISLYNQIKSANEYLVNNSCLKHEVIDITANKSHKKGPDNYSGRYFPPNIQKYLTENEKYQLCFTCENIGNREIKIYFTLFSKEELKQIKNYIAHVKMMYVWLHICANNASNYCAQSLEIFIYPTPFHKNLPSSNLSVMGPEHVNSGYSFACAPQGQIVIFREEEWFKVFLHETFHAYGLDKALHEENEVKQTLPRIFNVNSEFNIYEAYTETWARIINCALSSFFSLKNKQDKKQFSENILFCLEIEKMFALYQCNKILGFMGLEYKEIIILPHIMQIAGKKERKHTSTMAKYNENTHVFAYYVITTLLLNDYRGFIVLCKTQNAKLLRFEESVASFNAFAEYIKNIYNCVSLHHGFAQMGKLNLRFNNVADSKDASAGKRNKLKNTTRMSIIHTI